MSALLQGQVIAAFGRQYLIQLHDGSNVPCLTRGKKSEAACGDLVEISHSGISSSHSTQTPGVIEHVTPRSSLLYRSDAYREKLIAANVTQVVVVVAAEPIFSDELLSRCLVAAYNQKLEALIVLNKCDLKEAASVARQRLAPYLAIGYRVVELSALEDVSLLRPLLNGHTSVLVGQSGMGKSTLINALVPAAQATTREISTALDSGKHTTTHARLYRLDSNSALIDCPGVQAFGLHHLSLGEIEQGFIEFAPYLGKCRFHNCQHLHEPDCALRKAAANGTIDPRRLELFQQISQAKY